MRDFLAPGAIAASMALAVLAWDAPRLEFGESQTGATPLAAVASSEPIQPVPLTLALDPAKVALGARLFDEKRLSGDSSIACSSCHALASGGDDGRVHAIGIDGQQGTFNTPTVLNSGLSFRLFWDGRAATLEEQIDGPLKSPIEMGSSWKLVVERLGADPEYVQSFERLYPGGISDAAIRDALATFERSLLTPNAPFDQYLRGDEDAIGGRERRGYALFKEYGCIGCHQGIGIGGNMYQRLGIVRDYFGERGEITAADLGRFNVTGLEADRHVFKVPSLRNVALTAPYFHDGSAQTLEEAILVMARYQLGREIHEAEVALLAAFLRTLTGQLPGPS